MSHNKFNKGSKAYIIGVGPGDEDLLTLKAIKSLAKCTAVLYDRLIGNNILNYLSDGCEIYYCGKEPGCHYKTQEEINDNIVQLAKKGHIVGRVKGGDPYVFGRGGEEVLALIEHDIEFEVVPGITSPISVLNYAGIPITHRGVAQSFHIITGMSAGVVRTNWEVLAKEEGTLVFMMGLENLETIKNNLIVNGKSEYTPCAVVMRGTSAKQKKVVGNLENIVPKVKEAKLKSPCIIVVGEVVKLNENLNWYEHKPLFGVNVCVTRSKEQANGIKESLKELGAEITEINSIRFKDRSENLNQYLDKLDQFNHIVFTSANGVRYFFNYLIKNNYDVRKIGAKFSVIGKATLNALKDRGIQSAFMAEEFSGEDLLNVLKQEVKVGEKVMIPCSSKARELIKEGLENQGAEVHKVYIYDTLCGIVKNERAFSEVDIVLYTSPSTVKNMIDMLGIDTLREKQAIAIGPITYRELEEQGIKARICKEHTEQGLIEEIKMLWSEINVSKK